MKKTSSPFKPRARLLLELGNKLMKDEGIALFELVKNSYDADATKSAVSLKNIDSTENGEIIISDDGSGMDWETIINVWLEPGTDYRHNQVKDDKRTRKFKRVPMGQKGIGRFGAHKLGKRILLITRSKDNNEIVVNIDWRDFENKKYLEEVPVNIFERKPEVFVGRKTGTQLNITSLWNTWNRGMVRNVYRSINSICSPFKSPDSFEAVLELKDKVKENWLEGLLSWKEAKELKLFTATCYLRKDKLSYTYKFTPWETMTKVSARAIKLDDKKGGLITDDKNKKIDLGKYNIGKVKMDLYIYDLDSNIVALGINDRKGLKEFLDFNGGIRVYRDGIRVYDYGEAGNDWLRLGVRRVNLPSKRLSNNIVVGAVSINRKESTDLEEKTNREGFIENQAVKAFRSAIVYALTQIEAERNQDKERLRAAYVKTSHKEAVLDAISDLRVKIEKKGLQKELGGYLERIERDYKDVKENLLSSAGAGLSLSIVIHEIEKIIKELTTAVKKEKTTSHIKGLARSLSKLIEGYAVLIKREGIVKIEASALIKQALFNVNYRLSAHKINVINKCTAENDFSPKCSKRMVLGAIMNIIDNSIWWLENKNPEKKHLFISTTNELAAGPAIVIGDNGSGFTDTLEYVTLPFFTRKPDGMGLGLHITDEIMKTQKGKLEILEKGDIKLPKKIDGAVVALVFREQNK